MKMQKWFFLEDPENSRLRNYVGDSSDRSEVTSEDKTIPPPRPWLFSVRVPFDLKPEEVVCVTGDVPELGNWIPERCVPLQQKDDNIWSRVVNIPDKQKVHYRYCICMIVEHEKHVVVKSWETHITPRLIEANDSSPTECDEPEIYGTFADQTRIDKGWLSKGMIIQLKVSQKPFTLWRPKYQNRKIYIKVTPVNLIKHSASLPRGISEAFEESLSADTQDNYESPEYSFTEIASLNDNPACFKQQNQFGEKFKEGDMLIFQSYILTPTNTAFLIDLYIYSSRAIDDEPPFHAGFTYLLPSVLEGSEGSVVLPLTSVKHRPLGELRVEYLAIRPMTNVKCTMRMSYARHWKESRQGLDVGHRGSGSSFKETKDCSEIRENTIASLKTAISHGADYVEFDVQLSKDLIPVIYHDFHVCIAMKKKKDLNESDMFELPLNQLTLDQLRLLKIYHLTEGKTNNPRFFDEDLEEHQPFPTLKCALETLSMECGFNIEIKWNMKLMDGSYELNDPMDVNLYIDTILEVVLKHGCGRRIIFSCFNPDICSMIRLKQNKYPVMFLTQGETTKYQHYNDPRCWSIKAAISFVKMIEILGVNAHTEDILRDPSLVRLAKAANVILFCWGDENSDPATIRYLKELGLHGVIYDKIYQYLNSEAKESIYLLEARESQKELIRMAATSMEISHPPQPSMLDLKQKSIDLDKARNADNISTATSLASLESEEDPRYKKGF